MSEIGKKLEDMLSAASFAEAGEADTARELLKARKTVLVVLTGRPGDERSCKYAVNMAMRTSADLEFLVTADNETSRSVLESCMGKLRQESAGYTVSKKSGCVRESIIGHTKKRSDILCVVVESAEMLDIDCSRKHKRLEGVWKELGCPLTLVSERGTA